MALTHTPHLLQVERLPRCAAPRRRQTPVATAAAAHSAVVQCRTLCPPVVAVEPGAEAVCLKEGVGAVLVDAA